MPYPEFELEEFRQAYAHYRHLEQERSRHLTRFFTMMAGLLGFLSFLFKGDGSGSMAPAFIACLIVVFLQALEIFTFVAVRRTGDARAQHGAAIRHLRGKLGVDGSIAALWDESNSKPHISTHDAAEWTLHSIAVGLLLANGVLALYGSASMGMRCWQAATVLILTVVVSTLRLVAFLCLKPRTQLRSGQ
jgi:hypothetical protein